MIGLNFKKLVPHAFFLIYSWS